MIGISLPINVIVVIGLAVLVLAAVATFFVSTSGQQMSKVDAERIFQTKCTAYCDRTDISANYKLAAGLTEKDEFIQACIAKGIDWQGIPARCLDACSCPMSVSREQFNSNMNSLKDCLGSQDRACLGA